jgi:hypothetical protein
LIGRDDTNVQHPFKEKIYMAVLMIVALLVGAALAPWFGVDSRPGFTGRPDWRNRWS